MRPETFEPGERRQLPASQLAISIGLAVVLPLVTAAALIPVRADHGPTAAMVLVVPVVLVALIGGTLPAILASVTAGLAYDFFLTAPYYQLVIDDPDDVVTAITLVAVGLVVGVLSSRLAHTRARDTARSTELHNLLAFAHATTTNPEPGALEALAREHITSVLDLRSCEWKPGLRGGEAPTLLPDGSIMGYLAELNPDRAKLPAVLDLPAVAGTTEVGHFVLTPKPGQVSSLEERLTASTIAELFATAEQRRSRDDDANDAGSRGA